jgi:repressor LexA
MMMARKRSKHLTERQKKILEVLENFQNNAGYPPSIREICTETNITSTSVVNYYLEQLREMGYIQRDERISRGIRLVRPLSEIQNTPGPATTRAADTIRHSAQTVVQAVEELLHFPVLGRIVAGEPVPVPSTSFSLFDAESMVAVASSMLGRERDSKDLFALEVQGDSMIDAMVNDGDIVIMKPSNQARNGEMVAVWLNDRDETTLKYFYLENDRVRLQPANPTMEPIYIDDPSTVEIQGKVVMVIRKLEGLVA